MSDSTDYNKLIANGLTALNKKNVFLIVPTNSFPSGGNNTGIGTPYSMISREMVLFLKEHGFNGIQLTPTGITKYIDSSPYTGTLFSESFLNCDLEQLNNPLWGFILSEKTFQNIVKNNPYHHENKIAYQYLYQLQKNALKEAFDNFTQKVSHLSSLESKEQFIVDALNDEYLEFKSLNKFWLERDSVYEALCEKNKNDYWPNWDDDIEKKLYVYLTSGNNSEKNRAETKLNEIKNQYQYTIEFYQFQQFICSLQREDFKLFLSEIDFKLIADCQVAVSDRDFWANQHLFLEDYYLGAPPDYFSNVGQAWGFPIFDPEKLFDSTGQLAEGGEFLKNKFLKIFRENDGVRIDHIIGLIDPWVYKKNRDDARLGGGRLFSSPDHPVLKKYSYVTEENLNPEYIDDLGNEQRIINLTSEQIKKYGLIIEKMVIAAAKEAKGNEDFILICEDLGTITNPVQEVMAEYQLSGIRVTQFVIPDQKDHFYRGINVSSDQWITAGTHDNDTLIHWVENMSHNDRKLHVNLLVDDLYPNLNDQEKESIFNKLMISTPDFITHKIAELFLSPSNHIQIMFTDYFGMEERFNTPGTPSSENWNIRIINDYGNFYFQQLKNRYGVNIPEVISLALQSKGDIFAHQHSQLITELNEYARKFQTGV